MTNMDTPSKKNSEEAGSAKEDLKIVLDRIEHQEQRTHKRVIIFTVIPVAATIISLLGMTLGVATYRREVEELKNRKQLLLEELKPLEENIEKQVKSSSDKPVDEERILGLLQGRRKQAMTLAFQFKREGIPFQWGGKKPSEGFDSSGYIAYILAQVNLLTKPETYWSGRLREKYQTKSVSGISELQCGDLIFYENAIIMFYLGKDENSAIGMFPEGVRTFDVNFSKPIAFGKVPYEQ